MSVVLLPTTSYAHGDLHERIVKVSQEIDIHPDSSYLYFKRAKLYFQHDAFKEAIVDLDAADRLGQKGVLVDLFYAKSYQNLGRPKKALAFVKKIQTYSPNNVNAIQIKAEIYFSQKKYQKSALAYEKLIQTTRTKLPEHYLNAATAWASWSSQKGNQLAIQIIEKGIEELGPLHTFFVQIRDLHIQQKEFKQSLDIQNKIIATSKRKEFAYYEAAEICLQFNDSEKELGYLLQSQQSLLQLPQSLQTSVASTELKQKIEFRLKNFTP